MYVDVILPMSMPPLTYRCDENVSVGSRVLVPLGMTGARAKVGLVEAVYEEQPKGLAKARIREVLEVIDVLPLVPPTTLRFWKWLSDYYITPIGDVVRGQFSSVLANSFSARCVLTTKPRRYKRRVALQPPPQLGYQVVSEAKTVLIREDSPLNIAAFVDEIASIDGTILIIVPTNHEARIVMAKLEPWWSVEIYYPTLSVQSRGLLFVNLAVGLANRIVVGTRSALSLPFENLGSVVVLDEHSSAYKSNRMPRFSARDAAIYLSHLHNAYCYLVSPVPTLESYYNAKGHGWAMIETPKWKIGELNHIVLEKGTNLLSRYLINQITKAISNGKRAVIFQNRRGFSSYVECSSCGSIPQCPSCDTSLNFHFDRSVLACHHCGHSEPFGGKCPKCAGELKYQGRGTQRIEQQLVEMFPQAKVIRIDADSLSETPTLKMEPQWDIMVGTQVLLDQQISFSGVAVVAAVNADNMSPSADFRDDENTFRMLALLARRARAVRAEMVVQSSRLDNVAINAALAGDYEMMYNKDIAEREKSNYPPFVRLIKIEMKSVLEGELFQVAKTLEQALRVEFGDRISPIHQPLVSKQKNENIVQILMRIERSHSASSAKELMLKIAKPIASRYRNRIFFLFDVDPQ